MNRFDITYFYGPTDDYIVKQEVIRDIADAGFTLIPVESNDPWVNRKALALCREYGLKALVRDGRVEKMLYTPGADVETLAQEAAREYQAYDDVIQGWYIVDEPQTGTFALLGRIQEAFHAVSPGKEVYINLFPDYASPGMLQAKDYDDYLEQFMTVVRPDVLCYDYYHFLQRDRSAKDAEFGIVPDEKEQGIREAAIGMEDRDGFFGNMQAVWEKGRKYNTPIMLIVLLVEHGYYRNLTRSEILWEVSHSLVYGVKRMSYFTYWLPAADDFWKYDNAMTDAEGRLQPHYYDVQSINVRLAHLGAELFDKTSTAVFHLDPSEKYGRPFEPYGGVCSVMGGASVIGFFDDGSFLVTNKDFRRDVILRLETTGGAMEQYDDMAGVWKPAGALERLSIEAGGARLLRFCK